MQLESDTLDMADTFLPGMSDNQQTLGSRKIRDNQHFYSSSNARLPAIQRASSAPRALEQQEGNPSAAVKQNGITSENEDLNLHLLAGGAVTTPQTTTFQSESVAVDYGSEQSRFVRPIRLPLVITRSPSRTPSDLGRLTPREKREWRKDRESVDLALARMRLFMAIFGFLGAVCAIAQNELVLRQEDIQSLRMEMFKFGNMLCSLLLMFCLYRWHMLNELFERIRLHLMALHILHVHIPASLTLCTKWFWLEAIFFGIFLPPFCTFECTFTNWNNVRKWARNSYRTQIVYTKLESRKQTKSENLRALSMTYTKIIISQAL